jgi:hypothetical protein
MTDKAAEGELLTININKTEYPGPARGAVNGRRYEVPSGKDVPVAQWVVDSLRDSHVPFTIVKGSAGAAEAAGAEGSAPAVTLERTANRAEVVPAADTDPTRAGPPVLRGGDEVDIRDHGRGAPGSGAAETASESGGGEAFDAGKVVEGKVEDVTKRLEGLDAASLKAVRDAEEAKGKDKARKGVIAAIEEAEKKLAGEGGNA